MARFGRGARGFGRGYWPGAGLTRGLGIGRGMGNPYPYCRSFPWLPRRWWAIGMSPYAGVPYPPLRYPPLQR